MEEELKRWQKKLHDFAATIYVSTDPSHDMLHINRVVTWALRLAAVEKADPWVVLPAAYLHDMVNVPKNDPRRAQASRLSAAAAIDWLRVQGYPEKYFDGIVHAIEAHSFSARITPTTIEAKVVQDADRLDALGAVGIARCFSVNGMMGTSFYHPTDFFAEHRALDDKFYAVDHFFVKLFKIAETLYTAAAREEAGTRVAFMKEFLHNLNYNSCG